MDRQRAIETNRSIRNIKNELESLLEKGIITDSAFDSISDLLPSETPLSSTSASQSLPVRSLKEAPAPLKAASPAPPAYSATGPPALPSRAQPPPAPPSKPVLAHARALYKYAGADTRDVSFEKDDKIAIHEYMNDDWWLGSNTRTGDEGIFPKSYVLVEEAEKQLWPPKSGNAATNGPSAPVNPYNAHVPPMAIAEGSGGRDSVGKANDNGKKFGKKLGNAAIFGAGATIGGKIVNGIF